MTSAPAPVRDPAPTAPRPVVLKLGGTTIADQDAVLAEIPDVAHRHRVVVVHGGGKRLTDWLARLGVESRFENGLRVTDEATVEVAEAVLGGLVNVELVAALRGLGVDAIGLTGVDGGLLQARRVDGVGLVGSVGAVRRGLLDALFDAGLVPVVAPLAPDETGVVCNVNADDAAAGIAAALGARLVLMTDVDGVRDADGTRLDVLTREAAEALLAEGVIAGGMIPKVRAGLRAVDGRGTDAVIADGGARGALGRALDEDGFGTRLVDAGRPA